jgi:heme exporter protein B
MMNAFLRLLAYDIRLQIRHRVEWASLVLFFTIVILLLPFALGPEPDLLRRLAPGLIWLAAMLMSLLSLDRLFVQDARDGTLDMMLLSPMPLPLIAFSKIMAQNLVTLSALLVMLPPAALLLNMDWAVVPVLALTLVLGVPVMALLGGIVGAMTVALHRNAALLTLLLVPFYIPVMIFATSACDAVMMGASPEPNLLLLAALLALALPSAPFIMAAALRLG